MTEEKIMKSLVERYGGHACKIIRNGEVLQGWHPGRSAIAIRDIVALSVERPNEFQPDEGLGKLDDWSIDRSTASPILTYQTCSVIQDDQAFAVLDLVKEKLTTTADEGGPVGEVETVLHRGSFSCIGSVAVEAAVRPFVSSIVSAHATGSALVICDATLNVCKDGTAYIAMDEDKWTLEDDRCEGPDGPQGSVHWIARFGVGEIENVRDFLNGISFDGPKEHRLASEVGRLEASLAQLQADNERLTQERDAMEDKANRRVNAAYASMRADNDARRDAEARATVLQERLEQVETTLRDAEAFVQKHYAPAIDSEHELAVRIRAVLTGDA